MTKRYIDNSDMLREIKLSKERESITPALAKMFLRMTHEIARRDKFRNYCYLDEMKGSALLQLSRVWHKFDESKYDNPFAYFTTVIERTFWNVREKEKSVEMTKNLAYTANGMLGSYEYEELMRNGSSQYGLTSKQPSFSDDNTAHEPVDTTCRATDGE
jgi:hypothetical protein